MTPRPRLFHRFFQLVIGSEENLFVGAFFLLFIRAYRAHFGSFKLPLTWSRAHFYTRFLNNKYEVEERTLISKYLEKGDHVLELGACVGVVSCLTAKQIKGGRHCVVEANPHLLRYLYENRDQNGASFRILGGALSEEKDLRFYLNRNMVGGSSERSTNKPCSIIGIPPAWVRQQFGPFNTLVMDIEGGEDEFIEKHLPAATELEKLIIEFHPGILGADKIEALKEQLKALGFKHVEGIADVEYWSRQQPA